MTRTCRLVLVLVLLGLLGACSDDDGGDEVAAPVTTAAPSSSVTPTPGTAANCADQNFTPNSEDIASDIVATGLPCSEAEAFVRIVGPLVGATGEPAEITVGGFECVLTSVYDGQGLPSADYECTRDTQTVTFHRT